MSNTNAPNEPYRPAYIEDDEITLKELIFKIREFWRELLRYWWVIVAIAGLGAAGFAAKTYFSKPVYTATMTFMQSDSFWLWTSLLFVTRIGASAIEVMTESYFFKKITDKDVDILSFYRIVRPLAYSISPVVASILLIFYDIKYLFLVLGVAMIFGINFSLRLKDTK